MPANRSRVRKLGLIKFLLDQGADSNASPAKLTALQIAARNGDIGTALVLLEHGANIDAPPAKKYGFRALDEAASGGGARHGKVTAEHGSSQ